LKTFAQTKTIKPRLHPEEAIQNKKRSLGCAFCFSTHDLETN